MEEKLHEAVEEDRAADVDHLIKHNANVNAIKPALVSLIVIPPCYVSL